MKKLLSVVLPLGLIGGGVWWWMNRASQTEGQSNDTIPQSNERITPEQIAKVPVSSKKLDKNGLPGVELE